MTELVSPFYTAEVGFLTVLTRLSIAAFLGLLIGLDREYRSSPAGLRTHMLVSLAAATFAVLTFEIVERIELDNEGIRADPLRIIEAVTAGVAFLAAGTIIQARGRVRGLTTGAGMWLAGAIGLACGVGVYVVAIIATVLGIAILTALRWAEFLMPKKRDDARAGPIEEDADRS